MSQVNGVYQMEWREQSHSIRICFFWKQKNEYLMMPPVFPRFWADCLWLSKLMPYRKIRTMARPTAEIEASVPIQTLITSYFAASSWARNAWISCRWNKSEINASSRQGGNTFNFHKMRIIKLTRSSLLVRLVVSAFWLVSSSRMRLHLVAVNNQMVVKIKKN